MRPGRTIIHSSLPRPAIFFLPHSKPTPTRNPNPGQKPKPKQNSGQYPSYGSCSGSVHVRVRVKPHAQGPIGAGGQGAIMAVGEEVVEVRVAAPPRDGAANAALVQVLATALGARRGQMRIVSGQKSREKVVAIEGLDDGLLAEDPRVRKKPAADNGDGDEWGRVIVEKVKARLNAVVGRGT